MSLSVARCNYVRHYVPLIWMPYKLYMFVIITMIDKDMFNIWIYHMTYSIPVTQLQIAIIGQFAIWTPQLIASMVAISRD